MLQSSVASKIIPAIPCAALLGTLAGCQTAPPPALNPPAQAEAPRLAIGDHWVYRHRDGFTRLPLGVFTQTITAIDGDVVTLQVKNESGMSVATHQFTRDWNWLDKPMTNLQRFRYAPPYRAFQFPLAAGAEWSSQMKIVDVANEKAYNLARVDGRALDWQRITVPAGAFDAIRVERAAFSGTGDSFRTQEHIVETDWYSPAVNNLVAGSYRSSYRIKAAKPNSIWYYGDWTLVELVEYRASRN